VYQAPTCRSQHHGEEAARRRLPVGAGHEHRSSGQAARELGQDVTVDARRDDARQRGAAPGAEPPARHTDRLRRDNRERKARVDPELPLGLGHLSALLQGVESIQSEGASDC
jgi:hypothetical protein